MFYYYKTKKYLFNILRKLLYKKVFQETHYLAVWKSY